MDNDKKLEEMTSAQLSERRTEFATHRTSWAFDRTVLAHERTLMAWIRTATSMITFGFTIYKLLEESTSRNTTEKLLNPRVVGMTMILFGLVGLLVAQVQHNRSIKKMKEYYPEIQRSASSLLTYLILAFGVVLFFGAWFKQ